MNIKNSTNLLEYYKANLHFQTSFLVRFLPVRLRDFLIQHYTAENYPIFRRVFFSINLMLSSSVYILLYLLIKPVGSALGTCLSLYFFFLAVYFFSCQSNTDYLLKTAANDHYFQLLGVHKYDYLLSSVRAKGMRHFTGLITVTLAVPVLFSIADRNPLYLLNEAALICLLYLMSLSMTYSRLYARTSGLMIASNKYAAYFVALSGLSVTYLIFWLLNDFIFKVPLNLDSFSFTVLFLGYQLFLIVILIPVRRFLKKLAARHLNRLFIGGTFSVKRRVIHKPLALPVLSSGLAEKEKAIVIKDFKLLFRSGKTRIIVLLFFNFSFIAGAILLKLLNFSSENNLLDAVLVDGILLFFTSAAFFYVKGFTWLSSEKENFFIYNMVHMNYSVLLKAKKRVNYILFMPGAILYSFLLFFLFMNNLSYWLFASLYLLLILKFVIDKVLYYDFVGPKANINIDIRWIGDNATLGVIFTALVFMIPMGISLTSSSGINNLYMAGIMAALILANFSNRVQARKIRNIRRITYGGVIYDKV